MQNKRQSVEILSNDLERNSKHHAIPVVQEQFWSSSYSFHEFLSPTRGRKNKTLRESFTNTLCNLEGRESREHFLGVLCHLPFHVLEHLLQTACDGNDDDRNERQVDAKTVAAHMVLWVPTKCPPPPPALPFSTNEIVLTCVSALSVRWMNPSPYLAYEVARATKLYISAKQLWVYASPHSSPHSQSGRGYMTSAGPTPKRRVHLNAT